MACVLTASPRPARVLLFSLGLKVSQRLCDVATLEGCQRLLTHYRWREVRNSIYRYRKIHIDRNFHIDLYRLYQWFMATLEESWSFGAGVPTGKQVEACPIFFGHWIPYHFFPDKSQYHRIFTLSGLFRTCQAPGLAAEVDPQSGKKIFSASILFFEAKSASILHLALSCSPLPYFLVHRDSTKTLWCRNLNQLYIFSQLFSCLHFYHLIKSWLCYTSLIRKVNQNYVDLSAMSSPGIHLSAISIELWMCLK